MNRSKKCYTNKTSLVLWQASIFKLKVPQVCINGRIVTVWLSCEEAQQDCFLGGPHVILECAYWQQFVKYMAPFF